MKLGLEVLCDDRVDLIRGKRIGLITNPTGWDRFKAKMRAAVIGFFQRRIERKLAAA